MSPLGAATRFIDCINRRDLAGLRSLMGADHQLEVFDEAPLAGRDANTEAWRGYFDGFPRYVIHARQTADRDGVGAILGHTTGSHLGLPDDEEAAITLIWLAWDDADGLVTRWKLVEDTPENRRAYGLE